MVRDSLFGVLNPQDHKPHEDMIESLTFIKQIRQGSFSVSQLLDTLHDESGEIVKPEAGRCSLWLLLGFADLLALVRSS